MSNKFRYASPPERLPKINLLCKQKSSRITVNNYISVQLYCAKLSVSNIFLSASKHFETQ